MRPRRGPDDRAASGDVIIYSSWRGILSAAGSPLLLVLLGGGALWSVGEVRVLPLLLTLLGLALGLVAAIDFPRRSHFHRRGVTRVCLLRAQLLPWERIVAIERTAPSAAGRLRALRAGRAGGGALPRPSPAASGGLVARGNGRTRWLLTDRVEGALEHDRLRRLVKAVALETPIRAQRPPDDAAPSDLYRNRS
jgi:hypothetical protein